MCPYREGVECKLFFESTLSVEIDPKQTKAAEQAGFLVVGGIVSEAGRQRETAAIYICDAALEADMSLVEKAAAFEI
ncbi:MAG: hypothetical protein JWO41_613 [Candidatus Saccharibacteria bacterium]|nr:hypothetical protein [Candidatus Saccharibacteria bacterium]